MNVYVSNIVANEIIQLSTEEEALASSPVRCFLVLGLLRLERFPGRHSERAPPSFGAWYWPG